MNEQQLTNKLLEMTAELGVQFVALKRFVFDHVSIEDKTQLETTFSKYFLDAKNEYLQNMKKEWENKYGYQEVQRSIKENDVVIVDIDSYDSEEKHLKGVKDYPITVDDRISIPQFKDSLLSNVSPGQEINFKTTFKKSYEDPVWAGKEVLFKVKVKSIREKTGVKK